MPNWVRHSLTITGPDTERRRFVAECFTQHDEHGMRFDFQKLIPMPDHIERGNLSLEQIEKNPNNWYDWSYANWGTKWNACDTTLRQEGEKIFLSFDTAWSVPEPIFKEIAKRFPQLTIEGTYTDDMLNFGGDVRCRDGNVGYNDRTAEIEANLVR